MPGCLITVIRGIESFIKNDESRIHILSFKLEYRNIALAIINIGVSKSHKLSSKKKNVLVYFC